MNLSGWHADKVVEQVCTVHADGLLWFGETDGERWRRIHTCAADRSLPFDPLPGFPLKLHLCALLLADLFILVSLDFSEAQELRFSRPFFLLQPSLGLLLTALHFFGLLLRAQLLFLMLPLFLFDPGLHFELQPLGLFLLALYLQFPLLLVPLFLFARFLLALRLRRQLPLFCLFYVALRLQPTFFFLLDLPLTLQVCLPVVTFFLFFSVQGSPAQLLVPLLAIRFFLLFSCYAPTKALCIF